jgi:hypothetical protein
LLGGGARSQLPFAATDGLAVMQPAKETPSPALTGRATAGAAETAAPITRATAAASRPGNRLRLARVFIA